MSEQERPEGAKRFDKRNVENEQKQVAWWKMHLNKKNDPETELGRKLITAKYY